MFPKWPIKNGDFSTSQRDLPLGWTAREESGKHLFSMEPAPKHLTPIPSIAVIEAVEDGGAYYFQSVPLLKGEYRLIADVSGSDGAKARVQYQKGEELAYEDIDVSSTWKTVDIELPKVTDVGEAGIYLHLLTTGKVKFKNVKIIAKSLASAPIPLADGGRIGGIVLPEKPTLAEEFACYELQRCIQAMTGLTLGLKGRDETFDGILIQIGRVEKHGDINALKNATSDAYLAGLLDGEIVLVGNSDESTLYAAYDFLKQQGCLWVLPGRDGEVIPRRDSLIGSAAQLQSPDYKIRGFYAIGQDFYLDGGWISIDPDEYFDWAIRNRFNAVWILYGVSSDLGEHRGHGHEQMMNHSYNAIIAPYDVYFKDHPDWYPLVKGVRTPMQDASQPSQLCVSNQGLRDYTVDLALKYFRDNPRSNIFAMNPMDGVVYWCECDKCKRLDPPGTDWSRNGKDELYMTDRALNFANYVADEISKVDPSKKVSMYAYGCTRKPPKKESVHKNVIIQYASWQGILNKPFMDNNPDNGFRGVREQLDGWKKQGATEFTAYTYYDWLHPNAAIFWFNKCTEYVRGLREQYGFNGFLGETSQTTIWSSPTLYAVLANTLWNVKSDYKAVVKDTCEKFYGPAGQLLFEYNMLMDNDIMTSDSRTRYARSHEQWNPMEYREITLPSLETGKKMLQDAATLVQGDEVLSRRVAVAQFSNAITTLVKTSVDERKNKKSYLMAQAAFSDARSLYAKYGFMLKPATVRMLKTFYFPPIDEESVLDFPIKWRFQLDPQNVGITERWFEKSGDLDLKEINTDSPWTAQGYDYHGVAWYYIDFTLPKDIPEQTPLSIFFGAVDGFVDVYLDGTKIGEQKEDLAIMWDKSFSIVIPHDLQRDKTHRLAIRVRKDSFSAGIWKPLKVTKAVSVDN